jgi:protein TonB
MRPSDLRTWPVRSPALLLVIALAMVLAGCARQSAGSSVPSAESEPAPRTPAPALSAAPPSDEQNPKFGDYVYVEELPEAITKVAPIYPEDARKSGITGIVMVQALVRTDGTVGETRVVKSIPALDDAAMGAVKRWRFKPAMAGGHPVAVWVGVPVRFPPQ